MKKIIIAALIILGILIVATKLLFFKDKDTVTYALPINTPNTEAAEEVIDYEKAINNANVQLGMHHSGNNDIRNKFDIGSDDEIRELEKERKDRLNEQFRLKDVPNDVYVGTQISFGGN